MKVNDIVKAKPLNDYAHRKVKEYGDTLRVGKIGSDNIMFVNNECLDINDDSNFIWGFWLNKKDADLEVL